MTTSKAQITAEQAEKLIANLRALPDRPIGEHLSDDDFVDYAMEALEPPEIERLDTHLASCMECVAEMERLVAAAEIWATEPLPPLPTSPTMVETWWARLWKRVTGWFGPKEPIPESFKTLIIEVARGVITPLAAEELPLFQATCEAFFKDIQHALKVLADQRRPAEMLGFGIEGRTGSITPAVLGVTAEVVHFVAGRVKEVRPGEGDEVVVELVKVILGRLRPETEEEIGDPVVFSAVSGKPLPKWEHHPDRITEVRLFAIEQAARFGLPEEQALRLADALVEERASGARV